MLSKAPPVPESLKQTSEEHQSEKEAEEAEGSENAGRSADSVEPENEGGERITEEPQAAVENADAVEQREAIPRQVRAGVSNQQLQHRPAQRSTDDRLLTWAAVGLTVAIVFLLLKKLMKSSGYDAIFLSES